MYPEPTKLRLIDYLTESTWTPKSKSNMVDTKNQLADILTRGNIKRDEWNNLFRQSNIIFSSASCSETMSKRMQQRTGEERIVAKSKPTLNLVSQTAASSPAAPSSSASNRPEMLRAPSQQGSILTAKGAGKPAAGGSNQNDAAATSQVWLSDAKTNDSARKLAAVDANQDLSFKNVQGNLPQKIPKSSTTISRAYVPLLEKVYSNLRQQLKRKPEDNEKTSM